MYVNFYGVRVNMANVAFYRISYAEMSIEFYSGQKDDNREDQPFYSLFYDTRLELEAEMKKIDEMVSVVRFEDFKEKPVLKIS
jgi:hypothetical protein